MADPKIKYDIEANVKGDAEVGQLAGKLEALAKTLDGDLKTNANAAAAALRQLGDKQTAIARFVELKQGAQDAAAKLNDAQAAAQKMGQTLAATETPTRAQAGQMQKLGDAVRAAKAEVLAQNVAVQDARGALQQYGVSTQNLSQSQQNVKAAVGAAKLEINALVPAYAQAGQQATASGNQQRLANEGVGKSVASIGDQLNKIQNIAMIAVGGGFLGGIAKDALATADTFNNLQARIKLVTGEGALLTSSFQAVSDIALRTNSNLEQTGTLFTRVAEAGRSAGLSAQQAAAQSLSLTETINQSVQLSGGSAESSAAAVTQLIQALQSGVLRGEEFNSIMEQSPRLAKALADGLNVTTGELRKMAETGSLTTDVVIRSLKSQSDTIKSEFASLPPTVGRAIENLNTSWTLFVGNLDKGAGISKTVAGAIDSLAGNLNTVLTVAGHAAVAWGGYTLSQKLAAAGSTQSAIAIEQAALAATSQAVASGRAAVATSTHGKAAVLAAGQVAGYGAANTGAAAAANANATQVAAGATGYRAIGGAVLQAASKFALWGTVAYEGYSILKSTGVALGEGIAKWQGYKNAEEVMAEQEKKLAAAAQATADAIYKQSEAARIAKDQSFGLSKEAGLLAVKFDTLVKAGDSASEAIGKIGKDFDLSKLPGIRDAAGVLDKLKADGKLTATEFQAAWAKALDGKDLVVFETNARAAFGKTADEADKLAVKLQKALADGLSGKELLELTAKARAALAAAARDAERLQVALDAGVRAAVVRTGLDFENLRGGISATARSAVNDTQTIIDGLGRLSAQGVDTGRALTASIGKGIDTADTQKALDLVKQQIEAVRGKLGETVTNGLLDQAKQKGLELKDALEKAMPGINSVREAMGQLGITSDQTFKDTAEKSKAAYDVMRTSGLASARELSEGFKKSADDAIAANKGIAPSWVTAEAAARGYELQVDSAGKTTLRAAGEGVKGVDGLASAYKNAGAAAESAGSRIVSALEKQNAAQERLNAATDKAIELEMKRQKVDKEGFSTGKDGQRIVAGSDISTLTGVAAFLKAAGVADDAAARKLALEFSDGKGNIPYLGNAGQKKYGGASSTLSFALLKAAETYTFGTGSGSANAPSTIPAQTTTVNINLNGVTQSINTDAAGAATLQSVLAQLGAAKSTSAR